MNNLLCGIRFILAINDFVSIFIGIQFRIDIKDYKRKNTKIKDGGLIWLSDKLFRQFVSKMYF